MEFYYRIALNLRHWKNYFSIFFPFFPIFLLKLEKKLKKFHLFFLCFSKKFFAIRAFYLKLTFKYTHK